MRQLIFLSVFGFSVLAWGLVPAELSFQYQDLRDSGPVSCEHRKADVGVYEWDVYCNVEGKKHHYFVHLVLSFYPKTIHGKNAYELLYWVTDMTDPRNPAHDSSTIWIHNANEDHFMRVLEASQGIEDDMAYLKLTVKLPEPSAAPDHSSF